MRATSARRLLILDCLVVARATDYYVSTSGDNLNNAGTLASPFGTIARCAEAMSAGDRCCIESGTYREEVIMGSKSDTTFEACSGGRVLLDGTVDISTIATGAW